MKKLELDLIGQLQNCQVLQTKAYQDLEKALTLNLNEFADK